MTYYDAQGQRVTLDALCRSEPKWAAARIRSLTSELAASQAREARLREALETAIERLNADAQWAGQNADAQWVCLDCGAVAPDAVQRARLARPPSGEHADGCEFVAMMDVLRAALTAGGEGGTDGKA